MDEDITILNKIASIKGAGDYFIEQETGWHWVFVVDLDEGDQKYGELTRIEMSYAWT